MLKEKRWKKGKTYKLKNDFISAHTIHQRYGLANRLTCIKVFQEGDAVLRLSNGASTFIYKNERKFYKRCE